MTKTLEEQATDLLPRLAGNYSISVNDGVGLLNGKDKFERSFPVPPINNEAAQLIADQQARIRELEELYNQCITQDKKELLDKIKILSQLVKDQKKKLEAEPTEEEVEAAERAIYKHIIDSNKKPYSNFIDVAKAALEAARKVRMNKDKDSEE